MSLHGPKKTPFGAFLERFLPEPAVRAYAWILAIGFGGTFVAGTVAPTAFGAQLAELFQGMARQYQELAGGTLFLLILLNNVVASLLLLLSGVFLGILPVLSVGLNGFVLGVFFRDAARTEGYARAALDVLPHGVFEIPALLVAASYGLWLGMAVVRRIRRKESAPLGAMIPRALERYFVVVFPLLVVAAAVETLLILTVA